MSVAPDHAPEPAVTLHRQPPTEAQTAAADIARDALKELQARGINAHAVTVQVWTNPKEIAADWTHIGVQRQ